MEPGDLPTHSKDYYRGLFSHIRWAIGDNIMGLDYAIDMAQRYCEKKDFTDRLEALAKPFLDGLNEIEKELFCDDAAE